MRKYHSLLPIVGIAVFTLVGCGTGVKGLSSTHDPTGTSENVAQSSASTSTSKTITNVTTGPTGKAKIPYTEAQLMAMTPAELGNYNSQHVVPLPFGNQSIFRSPIQKGATVRQSFVTTVNGGKYAGSDFDIIDQWNGSVTPGQSFEVGVAKEKNGSKYMLWWDYGRAYEKAMVLDNQVWITNFTGNYVVFDSPTPAPGNKMYAINLRTGELLPNANVSDSIVRAMSGVKNGQFGHSILGLPKQYPTFYSGPTYPS